MNKLVVEPSNDDVSPNTVKMLKSICLSMACHHIFYNSRQFHHFKIKYQLLIELHLVYIRNGPIWPHSLFLLTGKQTEIVNNVLMPSEIYN